MGISQGTTQAFTGFSVNNAITENLNLFIAFAPVAFVYNQRSILLRALADLDMAAILELLGDTVFGLGDAVRALLGPICEFDPSACEFMMEIEMGPSVNLNASRLPFYTLYEIAPTSVYNMGHWTQSVVADNCQHMDWGEKENMKRYGQPTPPPYNLSKFPSTLPYALFTGGNDYLADAKDVAHLLSSLPTEPVINWYEPDYSHIDYVISTKANKEIYPEVLLLLKTYQT